MAPEYCRVSFVVSEALPRFVLVKNVYKSHIFTFRITENYRKMINFAREYNNIK